MKVKKIICVFTEAELAVMRNDLENERRNAKDPKIKAFYYRLVKKCQYYQKSGFCKIDKEC